MKQTKSAAGLIAILLLLFNGVGAIYGGTPSVALSGQCGPAAPSGSAACDRAQADVLAEQQKLRHKADFLRWYPVASLGIAVRF